MSIIHEQATANKELILKGVVLAIDPATGATSKPGYALFKKGKLVTSGVIDLDKSKGVLARLMQLYDILNNLYSGKVDVLAIEKIRSSHNSLRWSEITAILAVRAKVTVEVAPITWHKNVGKKYLKSDEADAIEIGMVLIKIAKKGR